MENGYFIPTLNDSIKAGCDYHKFTVFEEIAWKLKIIVWDYSILVMAIFTAAC